MSRRRDTVIQPPIELDWTLASTARLFGLSRDYMQELLRIHADKLREPRYRRVGRHPRLHRVLSDSEIRTLAGVLGHRTVKQRERRARAATAVSSSFSAHLT